MGLEIGDRYRNQNGVESKTQSRSEERNQRQLPCAAVRLVFLFY